MNVGFAFSAESRKGRKFFAERAKAANVGGKQIFLRLVAKCKSGKIRGKVGNKESAFSRDSK
jgi:hypothetical protein